MKNKGKKKGQLTLGKKWTNTKTPHIATHRIKTLTSREYQQSNEKKAARRRFGRSVNRQFTEKAIQTANKDVPLHWWSEKYNLKQLDAVFHPLDKRKLLIIPSLGLHDGNVNKSNILKEHIARSSQIVVMHVLQLCGSTPYTVLFYHMEIATQASPDVHCSILCNTKEVKTIAVSNNG